MDLLQLKNIAIKAALSAGKVIQKYKNADVLVTQKKGGTSYASQVVTAVDNACEKVILTHLLPTCDEFGLALLSEETEDDESRFKKAFFWCIDPMDGTLPFINKRPGFSVSIAFAVKGNGAYKNNRPWKIKPTNNHLTYVTDRKLKDTPHADKIEQLLNEKVAQLGLDGVKEISGAGSVLNGIYVLENGPACMLKLPKKESGGGSIWDFAATACIYEELGLPATNFEGGRLDLNRKTGTFMNHEGIFYANLIIDK